jgi:hypothetical protein
VQLVHHRAFYHDPPDRAHEHHNTLMLPPVAEQITFHSVQRIEMESMTEYSNQRWQYDPKGGNSNRDGGTSGAMNATSNDSGSGSGSSSNGPLFLSFSPQQVAELHRPQPQPQPQQQQPTL